jgi:hypothetical protein
LRLPRRTLRDLDSFIVEAIYVDVLTGRETPEARAQIFIAGAPDLRIA